MPARRRSTGGAIRVRRRTRRGDGGFDRSGRHAASLDDTLVPHDLGGVTEAGQRAHGELRVARNTNLADRQRIHGQLQFIRDTRRDRDAAAGERKQDRPVSGRLGFGEQLT